MADPQILNTLARKRNEIEKAIATYENRLQQARRDLAHVNATMHLFASGTAPDGVKHYQDIQRLFRRGEIVTICKVALAEHGPLDTRQLSRHVMAAKGFNEADNELRKAIAYRIVQALRLQAKRGAIGSKGRRDGVCIWNV